VPTFPGPVPLFSLPRRFEGGEKKKKKEGKQTDGVLGPRATIFSLRLAPEFGSQPRGEEGKEKKAPTGGRGKRRDLG